MSNRKCTTPVASEKGWEIQLIHPADTNVPSAVFEYEITRKIFDISKELSNIRICLCQDLFNQLQSCSYTVFFTDETSITSDDCFIDIRIPNPNENPASCPGLKFDNIPSGDKREQSMVILNFTLINPAIIGPVDIGFKAGNDGSDVWKGICGPVCDEFPSRGLII